MATWLTHIRVAELVYNRLCIIKDAPLFFAGSIAPDNGFEADISHWCVNGDKSTCDIKGFYRDYVLNRRSSTELDFYIGYYVHLYTDLVWQKQKILPLIKQGTDIKSIKQAWQKVDAQFLSENNNYYPMTMLAQANNIEKKWFDYCDVLTVKSLRDDIVQLCNRQSPVKADIDAQNEIDQFITACADTIINNWGAL